MNPASQFFVDLGAGDINKALSATSDAFTWTVAGRPDDGFALAGIYNKDRYPGLLARVQASMPDGPQVEITSTTETQERVVIEAHVHGRSADGLDYDNRLVYVFDLDGGKIAAVREYLDTIHAAEIFTR